MSNLIVIRMSKFIAAVLLSWALLFSTISHAAEEFTEAQKFEIIQIFQQFFLENPEIIREALIALEQKNEAIRANEVREIIRSQKSIIENPIGLYSAGNPDADVTLIEFFDYNDPNSKQSLADIIYLLENTTNYSGLYSIFMTKRRALLVDKPIEQVYIFFTTKKVLRVLGVDI